MTDAITLSTADRRSAQKRGFTLIELMVALTVGLLVSLAAMTLSKNATTFFQNETRMSGAQLSVTLGMNRLQQDISRAAYLSSPNAASDPFTCGDQAAWPVGLASLAGVRILQGGSVAMNPAALAQSVANGLSPDAIVLGGSFAVSEHFVTQRIASAPGGHTVELLMNHGSMARLIQAGTSLEDIFVTGRIVRITNGTDRAHYSVISGLNVVGDPPTAVSVQLGNAPALPTATVGLCGLVLDAPQGYRMSVISRVRYEIRSIAGHPTYGALVGLPATGNAFQNATAAASLVNLGEALRTELTRTELFADDADDDLVPDNPMEVVSEFAVDLRAGITQQAQGIAAAVTRMPITEPANLAIGAVDPERIRAVEVRLTVRARAPDRFSPIGADPAGGARRFLVINNAASTGNRYARTRTVYSDMGLPNQRSATW